MQLVTQPEVLLHWPGQDEADQRRRARPAGVLHQPAQRAQREQHKNIADGAGRLVSADNHDQYQRRGDNRKPDPR